MPEIIGFQKPSYLICHATAICNARCNFCANWRWNQHADPSRELTIEEFERVFRSLPGLLQLSFTGGEPSLRQDLGGIIKAACQQTKTRYLTLATNASLPDRLECVISEALNRFPETQFTVSLSVDGVGEIHDRIRSMPGLFERVLESRARLWKLKARHSNLVICINVTLQHENAKHMSELFQFFSAERYAVDGMTLSMARGELQDERVKDVSLETLQKVFHHWRQFPRRFSGLSGRIRDAVLAESNQYIFRTMKENRAMLPCRAGGMIAVLLAEGQLLGCPTLYGNEIGNVRNVDYDLKALVHGAKAESFRNRVRETRCYCFWECGMRANVVFNLRAWPVVLRELVNSSPIHRWRRSSSVGPASYFLKKFL